LEITSWVFAEDDMTTVDGAPAGRGRQRTNTAQAF
jgi:hypothetical protein